MDFAIRNEHWKGALREFRQTQTRSSAPRVWKIWVKGDTIFIQHGQLGGAMQQTHEIMTGVNIGKKNEKSPEVYALERAKYYAEKKSREGYREVDSKGNFLDPLVITIDFDNPATNLCFWKPDNSMGAGIKKKADEGKVWYTRKRDGEAIVITRGKTGVQIRSRRMHAQHDDEKDTNYTFNDRFQHLVRMAEKIMPENSIMLGELVVDRGGKDDRRLVASYMKSLTPEAIADMQQFGYPSFYCWDIAFWEGNDLASKASVKTRYELIHELHADWFLPIEIFNSKSFKTPEDAVTYAIQHEMEGFVVVDPEGIFGDRAYNFKGKPDRPSQYAAKLKPEFEDDFIALWDPEKGYGEYSTKGKYAKGDKAGIKSVALYQLNQKGEMVYICNCSTGMLEDMKRDWAKKALWPMVWKVGYTDRTYISQGDDTNALQFPKFLERREDKRAEECINASL